MNMTKTCKIDTTFMKGYKIKIYPTEKQKVQLNRQIDLYRFIYNWSLETIKNEYEKTKKFIGYFQLNKLLILYRNLPENEWLREIPVGTAYQATKMAIRAYELFFNKINNFPKFKSKKRSKKSFHVRSERVYLKNNIIGFEGKFGKKFNNTISTKNHNIPLNSKMYNSTISFDGDDYWFSCSIQYEPEFINESEKTEPIGIDLGYRNLAYLSDGTSYHMIDNKKLIKKEKRINKRLIASYKKYLEISQSTITKYEDVPKSNNFFKKEKALRKVRRKITNINKNFIHNMTREIVNKNPSKIVMESLNVRELQRSNFVGKYFANIPLYEIRRQIEYKSAEKGIEFILANPSFPSSQICSNCGEINSVNGRTVYKCKKCGLTLDRDYNAALNLKGLAYQ